MNLSDFSNFECLWDIGRRGQWGSLARRPGGAALRGSQVAQRVLTPVPTWVALIAALMLAVVSVLRFVGLISAAMPATLPSTLAILDCCILAGCTDACFDVGGIDGCIVVGRINILMLVAFIVRIVWYRGLQGTSGY